MERPKYAVSGSSGFIASHLLERLPTEQIERLDRTGFIDYSYSVVFDLAGYGNLASHDKNAESIYKANLLRVISSAESSVFDGKFIYVSTSSVILPVQTFYSASKKAAEEMLKMAHREWGMKVAIVRPYTIIGVGEHKEHLIPKLIDSCLNGIEMPFVPDPVHDFLDVNDFVDALLIIKDKGLFQGEIYEVGSGIQFNNNDIRMLVEEITGKKANIQQVESMRSYDTKNWRANTERICNLGWEVKKTLYQSIKEMVEHEKNNNSR